MPFATCAREALVASLRREVGKLEAPRSPGEERLISAGSSALDRLLPAGGLRPGTLVEYLSGSAASGAGTLALCAAREACRDGRALVVLDEVVGTLRVPSSGNGTRSVPTTRFYPLAAAAWGIDLSAMLVLRPTNEADALWALDQALRCPGVGAVWAVCNRLDVRDFRRLQLAAECGGALGLLVRPSRLRGQPTWADVQWEVRPLLKVEGRRSKVEGQRSKVKTLSTFDVRLSTWRLQIELVRCRGGTGGKVIVLELDERAGIWREVSDEATHSVPAAAGVGDSARAWRA